jgi:hypothetical protein
MHCTKVLEPQRRFMRNLPDSKDSQAAAVASPLRYCIDCAYRLDNIHSMHCPECGRPFDLADLRTTSSGNKLGWFARWALSRHSGVIRPCRWLPPAALVVVTAVVFLTIFRVDLLPSLLGLCFAFIGLGVPFVSRELARDYLVKHHGLSHDALKIDRMAIRRSRRIFIIGAVLILTRLPFYVIFVASLPALNRAAAYEWNVRPSNDSRPSNVIVGLFPVEKVEVGDGGINFKLPFGASLLYRQETIAGDPVMGKGYGRLSRNWYIAGDGGFELFPMLN